MSQFFLHWVDLVAMLLSVAGAVIFAFWFKKKAVQPLRVLPLFFLLFGPMVIVVHMGFHNLEIVYNAIRQAVQGKFVYHFRFYSLLLMGVLVLWLSVRLMHQSAQVYVHRTATKKGFNKTIGIIMLVTLPTVPFTPIGSLPAMACIMSVVATCFVRKSAAKQVLSRGLAVEKAAVVPISTAG